MPDQPYSNREVDLKLKNFEDISNNNRSIIMEGIETITSHLTELNHSVVSLKLWRAYLTGAVAVTVFVILPTLGYLAQQIIHNSQQVAAIIATLKK